MSSATDPNPEREVLVQEKRRTLAEGREAFRRYMEASKALYAYDDAHYTRRTNDESDGQGQEPVGSVQESPVNGDDGYQDRKGTGAADPAGESSDREASEPVGGKEAASLGPGRRSRSTSWTGSASTS